MRLTIPPGDTPVATVRFLILDDDPALLHGLAEALQLNLFRITIDTCQSAADALRRLQDGSGYDVVMTDLAMPDGNGLTFIQQARPRAPQTTFVLMTAHKSDHVASQAKTLGADKVIFKPFQRAHLIEALKDILKRAAERNGL